MNKQSKTGLLIGHKTLGVKKLKALLSGATLLTFAGLLASCSNESEPKPQVLDDSNPVLTLYIPNTEKMASRADKDSYGSDVSEAAIKSMYLYAFAATGVTGNTAVSNVIQLSGTPTGYDGYDSANNINPGNGDYKMYTVSTLKPGTYNFFVLANLEDYLDETSLTKYTNKTLTKDDIDGLVLKFAADKLPLSDASSNPKLPMICYYTDIKTGTSATVATKVKAGEIDGNYLLSASSQDPIWVDLSVLCAKVRYTILFDNDDFSSGFGSKVVGFDLGEEKTSLTNLLTEKAYKTGTADLLSTFPAYPKLDKANYPTTGSKYFNITSQQDSDDDLDDLGIGNWDDTEATKRAWQGTVYVPENKSGSAPKLTFTPLTGDIYGTIGAATEYEFTEGFENGNFYDVVMMVKNPGNISFSVYVKVNAWTYHSYEKDW